MWEGPAAPSALAFVDATLQDIKNKDILSAQDEKILQDLREKFIEGDQLSLEKLIDNKIK